jgi:hypothetical protein
MSTRKRIFISILIGVVTAVVAYTLDPFHAPGDLFQALRPAREFIENKPPLSWTIDPTYVPSPLTITPLGLPWLFMPEQLAGAIFFGICSALLAWVLRDRLDWLPLFASYSFVENLGARQYSPLLMTLSLTGLPAVGLLIKPHIALPLFLTHRSHWLGLVITAAVGVWSLIQFPLWPLTWLSQLHGYTGAFPILHPIGIVAFGLAVLTRQSMLALYCLIPLRKMYDTLPLFLGIRGARAVIVLTALSWLMPLAPSSARLPVFCLCAVLVGWWSKRLAARRRVLAAAN